MLLAIVSDLYFPPVMSLLSSRALVFNYDSGQSFSFPDILLHEGENLLIIGASGCGKTTLLHILAGILPPISGEVWVKGKNLYTCSKTEKEQLRGKEIGILFQQPYLIPSLTVAQNLSLNAYFTSTKYDKERREEILHRLGIHKKLGAYPSTLSQGEQQRVAFARAFLPQPALLLADEPTSSLDDDNAKEILSLLLEISAINQSAICVVTHDNRLKPFFSQKIALGNQ